MWAGRPGKERAEGGRIGARRREKLSRGSTRRCRGSRGGIRQTRAAHGVACQPLRAGWPNGSELLARNSVSMSNCRVRASNSEPFGHPARSGWHATPCAAPFSSQGGNYLEDCPRSGLTWASSWHGHAHLAARLHLREPAMSSAACDCARARPCTGGSCLRPKEVRRRGRPPRLATHGLAHSEQLRKEVRRRRRQPRLATHGLAQREFLSTCPMRRARPP